jgi:methyltransferase of ATP-grasp peptide maturase system
VTTNADTEGRRRRLADLIESSGDLRSGAWRQAVETVPREDFLRGGVFQPDNSGAYTVWQPVAPASPDYMDRVYDDRSWVTQIDGETIPAQASGPIEGAPTSSSTLPSLVVRMLEDLDVHDSMSVLEIGTGTGYSTGLLSARLGEDRVTSVEVDRNVASQAASNLAVAGYHPNLIVGDGLMGDPGRTFDRVIATCSVRYIPAAWLDQTASGGVILATLSGWMDGYALARLTVTGPGRAEGVILPGQVSFMPARAHQAPPLGILPAPEGPTRQTALNADLLGGWTARWLAQLAAPNVQRVQYTSEGRAATLFLDPVGQSAAWLATDSAGQWTLQQTGSDRLGDHIEDTITAWLSAGEPPQDEFVMTLTDQVQAITHPKIRQHWTLPTTST